MTTQVLAKPVGTFCHHLKFLFSFGCGGRELTLVHGVVYDYFPSGLAKVGSLENNFYSNELRKALIILPATA